VRKLSLTLHLWLGLAAGFFILAEGVTGVIIAWGSEIVEKLAPEIRQADPAYSIPRSEPRLPLITLVARLDQTYAPLRVQLVRFGPKPTDAWSAEMRDADEHLLRVWFDPVAGNVLGERRASLRYAGLQHFIRTAEKFHGDAPAAIALLLIAATGLILWWRRPFFLARRPFTLARTNLELHAAIGFYASLLLFFFAGTGVVMSQQRLVLRVGSWLTQVPVPKPTRREIVAGSLRSKPLDLDEALALATTTRAPNRFIALQWLDDRRAAVAFWFRDTERNGRTIIELSSGRVQEFERSSDETGAEHFVQWAHRAHEARVYGSTWRWIAGACGFLLIVLTVTGPTIWYLRRRARLDS
jgi:uncharacterized iron-regulated membrane protein